MKWPLLGIITVICVQLGFTTYNAVYRPLESLIAVNEIISETNPIAHVGYDRDDQVSFVDARQSFRNPSVNRQKDIELDARPASRKAFNVAAFRATENSSQLIAMQKPFEPVTITYTRAIPAAVESENYQVAARLAESSEKRSFASKSLSVLKKPYSLLKALGAKIM